VCRLLAVALQLEDPQRRLIGLFLLRMRFAETLDARGGLRCANRILLRLDVPEDRRLALVQARLCQIRLGLRALRAALFDIGRIVGLSLSNLIREILEAGRAFTRLIDLLDRIELGDDVAASHGCAIGNETGQRHPERRPRDLRHEHPRRSDCLERPAPANRPRSGRRRCRVRNRGWKGARPFWRRVRSRAGNQSNGAQGGQGRTHAVSVSTVTTQVVCLDACKRISGCHQLPFWVRLKPDTTYVRVLSD